VPDDFCRREPRQKMIIGERKSLTTNRVVLIPGPRDQVAVVCKMFQLAFDGVGCTAMPAS
jgi:hypothetical protein